MGLSILTVCSTIKTAFNEEIILGKVRKLNFIFFPNLIFAENTCSLKAENKKFAENSSRVFDRFYSISYVEGS